MKLRVTYVFTIVLLATAGSVSAQTLFSTRGLGVPLPAVDARARALGGIGVGLLGLNTSLVNPAEIAGLGRRGVAAALQPSSGSSEVAGVEDDLSASRFPLIRVIYPVSSRVVASVGYGGVLDESWAIATDGFERIGSDSVATRDVLRSTGGLGQVSVTFAYSVTPSLAIGIGGGLYTGSVQRRALRQFTDTAFALADFETRLRWEYRAPVAVAGVRFDPNPNLRVGASVTVPGTLDVRAKEGAVEDGEIRMPISASFGASTWLAPELLLAAGAEWSGRGGGETNVFEDGSVVRRNAWRYGGGVEWEGLSSGTRTFPVRLGGSFAQLPYYNEDEAAPSEWSAAFGLGFRLAGDEAGPLAVADIGIERGGRTGLESTRIAEGVTESFWRFTFSLSLFGR